MEMTSTKWVNPEQFGNLLKLIRDTQTVLGR
jgi:hypothetical protein